MSRLPITAPLEELADDPSTIRMPQRPEKKLEPQDLSAAITSEIAEPEPAWQGPPRDGRALPVAPPGERRLAKTIVGVGSPELHAELNALYADAMAAMELSDDAVTRTTRPVEERKPPRPAEERKPRSGEERKPPAPGAHRAGSSLETQDPHKRTSAEVGPSPADVVTGPVSAARPAPDLNIGEHVRSARLASPAGQVARPPRAMIPFGEEVGDNDKTIPAGSLAKALQQKEASALSGTDKLAAYDVETTHKDAPIEALSSTDKVVALAEDLPPPLPDDATSPAPPHLPDNATSPSPPPGAWPGDSTARTLPPVDEPVSFDPAPLLKARLAPPARGAAPPVLPGPAPRGGPSNLLLVLLWVVAAVSVGVAVFLYAR